jgi:hypothetical protein
MSKTTPGPWEVVEDHDGPEDNRTEYFWIKSPERHNPVDHEWAITNRADAYQMAASPEMREALGEVDEVLSARFRHSDESAQRLIRKVKAAIAKADGASS